MMSLSKEWALLSKEMYGQKFIDELAEFLQKYDIKTILECGCGDGYVLQGLAKKGFRGLGIDACPEMVALALANHQHSNICYRRMNWLDIGKLKEQFDAVICRGGSLLCTSNWKKRSIDTKETKNKIEESINLFFQKLKQKGLLYVDCVSQAEIEKNGGDVEIKTPNIQLKGKIEYDWQKMVRKVSGGGKVFGEDFSGCSFSYLLIKSELERIIKSHNPCAIWHQKLDNEMFYDVVCAKK